MKNKQLLLAVLFIFAFTHAFGQFPKISKDKDSYCSGETATLTVTGCSSGILWSNGATTSSIQTNVRRNTVSCLFNNDTQSYSDSIYLPINQHNLPYITQKGNICLGGTNSVATLKAYNCLGATKIEWGYYVNQSSPILLTSHVDSIQTTKSGFYNVACQFACSSDTSKYTSDYYFLNGLVIPPTISGGGSLCANEKTTLIATGCNGIVTWSTAETGNIIQATGGNTYWAKCQNDCGISNISNQIIVTKLVIPTAPTVIQNASVICSTDKATLVASSCDNSGTLLWNTGQTTSIITVNAIGTYAVNCVNTCGTSFLSNLVKVSIGATTSSPPIIFANRTSVCGTDKATLTAIGCTGTVIWSTGESGTFIQAAGDAIYTAKCNGSCGLSVNSNQIIITTQVGVTPNPPSITGDKSIICDNDIATLTASGCIGEVLWSNGQTGVSIGLKIEGIYTAKCQNSCGISLASNQFILQKSYSPAAPVVTPSSVAFCDGDKATLHATCLTGNLLWSILATTSSITVASAGTFSAICTNICGASNYSNVVTVQVGYIPTAPTISSDFTNLCNKGIANLTASNCNYLVNWSNGVLSKTSISVNQAGNYFAYCSNVCGSSGSSNAIQIATCTNCKTICTPISIKYIKPAKSMSLN